MLSRIFENTANGGAHSNRAALSTEKKISKLLLWHLIKKKSILKNSKIKKKITQLSIF